MKRPLFILAILFFLTASTVLFAHKDTLGVVFSCKSFAVNNPCILVKVDKIIDSKPEQGAKLLVQLASLRSLSLLGGDYRAYSSSLHRLGHNFFMNGSAFDKIGELCPALVKDGCIHGYVMEYINQNSIEAAPELCDQAINKRVQLACIHASGHSYLEFNNQTIKEATHSFCKNYSDIGYAACVSGLFHEYSKTGEGMGHEYYYQRPHDFNNFSCDDFTGQDYTMCYGSQGSFRQYFPESEPLRQTYEICDKAKTPEAIKSCKYNAKQRLDIARGYSFVNP